MSINKLKLGEVTPSKLYLGESEVLKAYMRETLVYEKPSSSGETWVLKSSDMIAPDNQINVNINFHNCANDNFTKISIYSEGKGVHISYFNGSDETIVLSGEDGVTGDNATITFATSPTGNLLTWLQANAVKQ